VPRIEAGNLLLIQIGVRSDWYDGATETVYKNHDGLQWFAIVWKVFARRLRTPISARDVRGGDEVVYRSLYYSNGAEHWYRGGGRPRQEGVANVEYLIPSTREKGSPCRPRERACSSRSDVSRGANSFCWARTTTTESRGGPRDRSFQTRSTRPSTCPT
jgi:hypothetical protein